VPDYGVSGTGRRYALIVAMLVALATVPLLLVMAVGVASVDGPAPGGSPVLGPPGHDPVVIVTDDPPPAPPPPAVAPQSRAAVVPPPAPPPPTHRAVTRRPAAVPPPAPATSGTPESTPTPDPSPSGDPSPTDPPSTDPSPPDPSPTGGDRCHQPHRGLPPTESGRAHRLGTRHPGTERPRHRR
jgi:hypothetical protein